MASDPDNTLHGGKRTEHGLFTPEPSVEPEHAKDMQTAPPSSDQSKPVASVAGSSTQPAPDADSNAEPAGQSSAVEGGPKGSERSSSATGDIGQAEPPTDDSSKSEDPNMSTQPTEGAATGDAQPPPGVSDLQAREIERIMAADPKLAFKILGLAGIQGKDQAEERYQELVQLLRPENCGHPRASEAIKSRCSCGRLYRAYR